MTKVITPPQTAARDYDRQRALLWNKYHPIRCTDKFYSWKTLACFFGVFVASFAITEMLPKYLKYIGGEIIIITYSIFIICIVIAAVESLYQFFHIHDPINNRTRKLSSAELRSEYDKERQKNIEKFSEALDAADRKKLIYRDIFISELLRRRDWANKIILWSFGSTGVMSLATFILKYIDKKELIAWAVGGYNANRSLVEFVVATWGVIIIAALVFREHADGTLDIARRPMSS